MEDKLKKIKTVARSETSVEYFHNNKLIWNMVVVSQRLQVANIKKAYFSVFDNKLRLLDIWTNKNRQKHSFTYI